MEVWADFILECQILSQTSNLYLTVQGSGVGITPADSNSTSVYSRCRNKPRILNIYENLYIYSIYLNVNDFGRRKFPRFQIWRKHDPRRNQSKRKRKKTKILAYFMIIYQSAIFFKCYRLLIFNSPLVYFPLQK